MGPARQPMAPGQKQDYTKLQRVLQCIISDFGLVNPPMGGCPTPNGGGVQQDEVQAISEAVLARLKAQGVI